MINTSRFASLILTLCLSFFSVISFAEESIATPIPDNAAPSQSVTVSAMEKEQGAARTISTGSFTGGGGGIPAFTMTTNPDGSEDYSVNLQILALMTMLGFLPAMVILMTSFTRIVVV